jgi:hypothetical protein
MVPSGLPLVAQVRVFRTLATSVLPFGSDIGFVTGACLQCEGEALLLEYSDSYTGIHLRRRVSTSRTKLSVAREARLVSKQGKIMTSVPRRKADTSE